MHACPACGASCSCLCYDSFDICAHKCDLEDEDDGDLGCCCAEPKPDGSCACPSCGGHGAHFGGCPDLHFEG